MKNNLDMILSKITLAHKWWVDVFSEVMPDTVKARERQFSRKGLFIRSMLLRIVILVLNGSPMSKAPRYIFQGLRHRSLIEALPVQDVMVLGGRNEWLYCIKKGYRFHWIGYISHAFNLYIWGGQKELLTRSVRRIQQTLLSMSDNKKRYLLLWEDSLPTGLTLSVIFETNPNINVVCIAHGFFYESQKNIVPSEGMNCKFNLVWDQSQKKAFPSELDARIFVLGLPYEVSCPKVISREVVLVGHCGLTCNRDAYLWSLHHFFKIFMILHNAGWVVAFRPHPLDDVQFIRKIFPIVYTENKLELFSKKRVYIGINSSLLYEARQCGNVVIGLDTSTLVYDRAFDVDRVVLESEYDQLPFYLETVLEEQSIQTGLKFASLADRLNKCLKQIDESTDEVDHLELTGI